MVSVREKRQCSERVYGGRDVVGHQCSRRGVICRRGAWYCKTHDPVSRDEKRKVKHAAWEAEWAAKRKADEKADRVREAERKLIQAAEAWYSTGQESVTTKDLQEAIKDLREVREL